METGQGVTSRGEWPNLPWELTAPESYVLYHGPNAGGGSAFKLALLDLVARGALHLVEVEGAGGLSRRRKGPVLTDGTQPPIRVPRALAGVVDLFETSPRHTFHDGTVGVAVADLTRAARRRYKSFDRFVSGQVLSSLIERGLFASETWRRWGLVPVTQYVLTSAGETARADLKARLALGEHQFIHWIDREPERAANFVGFAGAAVLLMPAVLPELRRLRQLTGWSGAAVMYLAPIQAGALSERHEWLGFDPSLLDTLDTAVSAIGSGVEQGGGLTGQALHSTGGGYPSGGDGNGVGDVGGAAGGGGDGGGW